MPTSSLISQSVKWSSEDLKGLESFLHEGNKQVNTSNFSNEQPTFAERLINYGAFGKRIEYE
jgi:hypothetical protein